MGAAARRAWSRWLARLKREEVARKLGRCCLVALGGGMACSELARTGSGVACSGLVVEGGRGAELLPGIDFGPLGVLGLAECVERVLAEQEQARRVG